MGYIRAEAICYVIQRLRFRFENQEIEREEVGKDNLVKDVHAIEAHHEGKQHGDIMEIEKKK